MRINRHIKLLILSWKFWSALIVAATLLLVLSKETLKKQVRFRRPSMFAATDYRQLYRMWRGCIAPRLQSSMNNSKEFWDKIPVVGNECGNPIMKELNVLELKNTDEIKYYIPQKEEYTDAIVVSLGIGHDILTEEKLKEGVNSCDTHDIHNSRVVLQGLENVRIEFFGADPVVEVNKNLYETIGTFLPFAVNAYSGIDVATVLEESGYLDRAVTNIEATYFFNHFVRRNRIDLLILDAESAEYALFPFFKKDGLFDKNNITFCQINMEIHRPNIEQKEQILDFFNSIMNEEKYIVLGFVRISMFLRMFMVNFSHPECVTKYLPLIEK